MGELQERITSTKKGAITSVQAVYVPADDPTDPAPANASPTSTRSFIWSATSPPKGFIRPSIRWLHHRAPSAPTLSAEHNRIARKVQSMLQRYRDLQDIIAILASTN